MTDPVPIWTIGHSTHPWEHFVKLLDIHQIELVADVRSHPGSNRNPQFNIEAMQQALGRRYGWLPNLGGPSEGPYSDPKVFPKHHISMVRPEFKDIPEAERPKTWWNRGLYDYATWMSGSAQFMQGIEDLRRISGQRVAIMCAEALWWKCHRSMISDAWIGLGGAVYHIMGPGIAKPHALGDRLERYPPETRRLWEAAHTHDDIPIP